MLDAALPLAAPGGFAVAAALSYVAPDVVRRRSIVLRRAVAIVAGVAAFFAHTEPTSVAVIDVVAAPLVAAGITLLGARARTWTVALAAVGVALLSIDTPAPALAFASGGASLAIALTARRSPVVTAIVAGAVVNAALRLTVPGPFALESVAAVAVLAPIAASGYTRLQRSTRRYVRNGVLASAAVTAAIALTGFIAVLEARPDLERGVSRASAGLAAARLADQDAAASHLDSARDAFGRADDALDVLWARPAFAIPIIGPHLRALHVAAKTGEDLADAGGSVALAANLDGVRLVDGQLPLDRIAALHTPLGLAATEVSSAQRRLRVARSGWLVPPVRDRLDANLASLDDASSSLRSARDVVGVLPELLGANGARRWFLAVQTPSEARASGGFIGNFGEIVADRGKLDLVRFGRTHELNEGGGAAKTLTGPDDYVARYGRFEVAHTWQNVTMSPDFPSVANVIGGLYPQSGGQPVDGVIAVDPAGVAALLKLTGPLTVPRWPEPLTAENAERVLLYEQYVTLKDADRVDFLGDATRTLWERLTSGTLPAPGQMLAALGPAVAGHHIMISSLSPEHDAVLASVGVNGRMTPVRGDALAVMTQNATASKIEWFLRREVEYEPSVGADGALTAKLRVRLYNDAPPAGLPDYLIGNTIGQPRGTNRVYVSVYTPWTLTGARIAGQPAALESERELDRRVYSAYVDVPPRGDVTVELDLAGTYDEPGGYRLDLWPQPLVTPDRVKVTTSGATQSFVLDRARSLRTA